MLRDRQGAPVLIDLDGFAIGPREWDLVLTAMYYDSFGWHTRQEYEDFARVYGYDIMQWPGYPVLREIREFLMVTWLIQKAAEDARAAAEAAKRIDRPAHRREPQGLAAVLGDRGGPVGPCGDPPQPGLHRLLAELPDRGRRRRRRPGGRGIPAGSSRTART